MLHPEIEHRNGVLRAYFAGRNWDSNSEFGLKRKLVMDSANLLPDYPYVIEDEWEVEPNRADQGRGDLVFTDGAGGFAVVEVKWIDLEGEGRKGTTRRKSNQSKRQNVQDQALKYAEIYAELAVDRWGQVEKVKPFIYTNQHSCPCLLMS